MKTLHFEVSIRAPRKRVWDTMLEPDTYREWTRAFADGSHYDGSWEEGASIRFLGPTGDGMFSRIAERREPEHILIEHLGVLSDGKEDRESDLSKAWAGAKEAYHFSERNGLTTVVVDVDAAEEVEGDFSQMWPSALAGLKELCEERS